jgi:Ca2+-binding EF-hand superfamily protein
MKRSGLTSRFLPATLFLTVICAAVLNGQEPAMAEKSRRSEAILKRFDKNGDGRIDEDERIEAKEIMLKEQAERMTPRTMALPPGLEPFRAEALAMFDQNRDGQLDEIERGAAQRFVTGMQEPASENAELKRRFDQDGDGKIDDGERAKLDQFVAELRALGTAQMRVQLLQRFDLNLDGKIDDEEFPELEKFVRPRIEANKVQVARYDSDGDGRLDEKEWAAARIVISAWLNASGPAALDTSLMRPDPAMLRKAVVDEVARRREARENGIPMPAPTATNWSPIEEARLKAVAEEVARRRAERAAAEKQLAPK